MKLSVLSYKFLREAYKYAYYAVFAQIACTTQI
jgi:hypothetical protein